MSSRLLRRRAGSLAPVSLIVWAAAACEERERANPFDPDNPDTRGVPALLDARAGDEIVDLAWDLRAIEGIARNRVQRRFRDDVVKVLTPEGLDPQVRTYRDLSPENGVRYEYRLELELSGGERVVSAWDSATPGDAIPWVADSDGGGLSRLTPDARDRVLRIGQGWIVDLAADPLDPGIWSVDYLNGTLLRHSLAGTQLLRVSLPGARAVAVDLDSSGVWVASFDRRLIERRRRDGSFAWSDSSAGYVEDLLAVAPSGVWLANRDGEIHLYRDDRRLVTVTELRHPIALAGDRDGRILVLERGTELGPARVRRYDRFGIPLGSSDEVFSAPTDLTQDVRDAAASSISAPTSRRRASSRTRESWGSPGIRTATGSGPRGPRVSRSWTRGESSCPA
jgi:hypothetical protein